MTASSQKRFLPRHVQSAIYAQIMRKQLTKYELDPVAAIYLGTKEQKDKPSFALRVWQQERQQSIFGTYIRKIKSSGDQAVIQVSKFCRAALSDAAEFNCAEGPSHASGDGPRMHKYCPETE